MLAGIIYRMLFNLVTESNVKNWDNILNHSQINGTDICGAVLIMK